MARRTPLFLRRRSYRQRRLRDAARLLPLAGGFFMLLPILWAGRTGARIAGDGVYLFTVWIVLVAVAAALAPGLARDIVEEDGAAPPPPGGDGPR